MLTDADIHAISQKIQQSGNIIPDNCTPYCIELAEKGTIKLCEAPGRLYSIPTDKLSDIHAILQLCHPNTPYYLYRHIYLSEELPGICLYNYKHAPNILTIQPPSNQQNNTYTVRPTNISNTIVEPNESITNAIERFNTQIEQSLAFVHQYPHINVNSQQLNSRQKIPHLNNIDINITTYRVHPSNIEIIITLCNQSNWVNTERFIIPTQNLPELADRYVAHMQHITPKLIQNIQQGFSGSQHEKIHIIRQAIPYLARTDNNIFACIQDCVHILLHHYA